MAVLDGIFIDSSTGKPVNGASAKLWNASAFVTPPAKNDSLPGSGQVGSTVTTGIAHGSDGAYRFTSVAVGSYYISIEYNGNIGYEAAHVGRDDANFASDNLTAATITTAHAKFKGKPWFDVTGYGALGDGVNDDSAAIQAAVNAAIAVSGGTVYMPHGTYKLGTTVTLGENITFMGGGVTSTTVTSPSLATAILVSGTASTLVNEFSIRDFSIVNGSSASGSQVLLDLQFCAERSVTLRDLLLDGSNHGCTGIRLYNSWGFNLENLSFIRFPSTAIPALELRSTESDGVTGHPMNTIGINYCRWQESKYGVQLQNEADVSPGPLHNITFLQPRMKLDTMDSGSYGIRGVDNQIWGVHIIDGFFEDIARPIVATGFNWGLDGVFIEHAVTGITFATGGGHGADRLTISGPTGNEVAIAVHVQSGITQACRLLDYTLVPGTSASQVVYTNNAGLLGAPAAVMPSIGASNIALDDIGAADRAVYIPVEVRQTVLVTGAKIIVGTQSGNISAAWCDNQGNRLATTGEIACPATGRQNVNFTAGAYSKPGMYYLALSADNTTATFGQSVGAGLNSVGLSRYLETTGHPIPATVTFTGITNATPAIVGRVDGSYA